MLQIFIKLREVISFLVTLIYTDLLKVRSRILSLQNVYLAGWRIDTGFVQNSETKDRRGGGDGVEKLISNVKSIIEAVILKKRRIFLKTFLHKFAARFIITEREKIYTQKKRGKKAILWGIEIME